MPITAAPKAAAHCLPVAGVLPVAAPKAAERRWVAEVLAPVLSAGVEEWVGQAESPVGAVVSTAGEPVPAPKRAVPVAG